MDRFFGIIVEHFGGAFPTWLSPVQAKILPIAERHLDYANKIFDTLKEKGIRVELDERNETLGNKIRNAQNEKVSYMLIVGDKEIENKEVSIRDRSGKSSNMNLLKFTEKVFKEIEEKSI